MNSMRSLHILKAASDQHGTEDVRMQASGRASALRVPRCLLEGLTLCRLPAEPCHLRTPNFPNKGLCPHFVSAIVLVVLIVNSISVRADEQDTKLARIEGKATLTANVGMMASILQVVFPGTELIPLRTDSRTAPVVIRIDAVYPHGDGFRYDLTWTACEAGRHDLSKYLTRQDGTSTGGLPTLEVTANSILAPDRIVPNAPEIRSTTSVGGYRTLVWMAGILWIVGLAVMMATRTRATGADTITDSPQDRLDSIRTLLQLAASGAAFSAADKAKLEGLIVGFWREHKQIQDLPAQLAIARLREDADAGPLLKQLERWLYDRPRLSDADLVSLLLPLQAMVETVKPLLEERHA